MLAEARARITRYTPDEVRADRDLLVEPGVGAGDQIGGYEAW